MVQVRLQNSSYDGDMRRNLVYIVAALAASMISACEKPQPPVPVGPEEDKGFVEEVPDTVSFANAEFIYDGDDVGEAYSDGWLIKFYTEMEIDEAGAPIGPGSVVQLLLNAPYDEDQSASADFLTGIYTEMYNSGNFAPGTFVSGYMTTIDLPGQRLEIADATFYADVEDGSTTMDYDLIDEGVVQVLKNEDGTFTVEGILVGTKYTKRYFTWTGTVEPRTNVQEEVPNSTLRHDLTDLTFVQGQLQDRGDCFYLMDQSYRCLLLYLADEGVDMSSYRPAGDGAVLRLEFLVPWETDITKDGMPVGTYPMIQRNPDTSYDRDRIVPGVSIEGLPDVFAEWKMAGSWYYELLDGVWTQNYARIHDGKVSIEKDADGIYTVSYDLLDCQAEPKRITGMTVLDELLSPDIPCTGDPGDERPQLNENEYALDDVTGRFASVAVSNLGEYICLAASPQAGVRSFDAMFEQDEYFYVAISPLLNGKDFDLMTEDDLYTVMSTLEGAELESVAPSMLEEITAGQCRFEYKDGTAVVEIEITLADGGLLRAKLSAEEQGIVVNENIFSISGNDKPVRTAFHLVEDGITALYLTPAGIDYFDELSVATYYAYIKLDTDLCDGRMLSVDDIIAAGYADNFNELIVDSDQTQTTGTVSVQSDPHDPCHYIVVADLDFAGTTVKLRFDGETIDANEAEEVRNEVVYEGRSYAITAAYVDEMPSVEGTCHVMLETDAGDMLCITLPVNFLDGNAHGFSQSANLYVEFGGRTFSKAEGYSGTVTVSTEDDVLKVDMTNYDDLEVTYKGPYEIVT